MNLPGYYLLAIRSAVTTMPSCYWNFRRLAVFIRAQYSEFATEPYYWYCTYRSIHYLCITRQM